MKLKPFLREYWAGATQPSLAALLTCLLVILLGTTGLNLFIPKLMASEKHRYFAKNGNDVDVFTTGNALALANRSVNSPAVVILGASAIRNAIMTEKIEELLERDTGARINVFDLTTSRQTFWDAAALADMIPKSSKGIAVIGVGANRLTFDPSYLAELVREPRLACCSVMFDQEARLAGIPPRSLTGVYLWDNRKFFLARSNYTIKNLITGPPNRFHRYLGKKPKAQREWQDHNQRVMDRFKHYAQQAEENLAVISRIVERLRTKTSMSVVLLEPPMNQKFVREYMGEDRQNRYQTRIRRFAQEHDLLYWDLNDKAKLTESDYYDWCHLRLRDAVARYTTTLANNLSALLTRLAIQVD